jgi:hypothetical protein
VYLQVAISPAQKTRQFAKWNVHRVSWKKVKTTKIALHKKLHPSSTSNFCTSLPPSQNPPTSFQASTFSLSKCYIKTPHHCLSLSATFAPSPLFFFNALFSSWFFILSLAPRPPEVDTHFCYFHSFQITLIWKWIPSFLVLVSKFKKEFVKEAKVVRCLQLMVDNHSTLNHSTLKVYY